MTKFWVGVTDNRWFSFLRSRDFDEVNFWQPSAKALFTGIAPGTPFFFKLKRPYNHIGGYGIYVSFVRLPLRLAWEAFGEKNGAPSFDHFSKLIRPLMTESQGSNPEIGCTLLATPRFFTDDEFVPAPADWSSNIVRGKSYGSDAESGRSLLSLCQDGRRLDTEVLELREDGPGYSAPFLARARLGQGTFRALVTDAYARRRAITGENILPVLDAAHIRPYAQQGPHQLSNGLLLRSDFHKLFDLGYITVSPELRVEVSSRIKEEWFNGKAYYRLHGERLATLPAQPWAHPSRQHLDWHNQNVYQG